MELLNINESTIVDILAEAWRQFVELEELHSSHQQDFSRALHEAQRIVMCRPVCREIGPSKEVEDEGIPNGSQ